MELIVIEFESLLYTMAKMAGIRTSFFSLALGKGEGKNFSFASLSSLDFCCSPRSVQFGGEGGICRTPEILTAVFCRIEGVVISISVCRKFVRIISLRRCVKIRRKRPPRQGTTQPKAEEEWLSNTNNAVFFGVPQLPRYPSKAHQSKVFVSLFW